MQKQHKKTTQQKKTKDTTPFIVAKRAVALLPVVVSAAGDREA
jgi:hypothetical protein